LRKLLLSYLVICFVSYLAIVLACIEMYAKNAGRNAYNRSSCCC